MAEIIRIRAWLVDQLMRLLKRRGDLYLRFSKLKGELIEIRQEQIKINEQIDIVKQQMEDQDDNT